MSIQHHTGMDGVNGVLELIRWNRIEPYASGPMEWGTWNVVAFVLDTRRKPAYTFHGVSLNKVRSKFSYSLNILIESCGMGGVRVSVCGLVRVCVCVFVCVCVQVFVLMFNERKTTRDIANHAASLFSIKLYFPYFCEMVIWSNLTARGHFI